MPCPYDLVVLFRKMMGTAREPPLRNHWAEIRQLEGSFFLISSGGARLPRAAFFGEFRRRFPLIPSHQGRGIWWRESRKSAVGQRHLAGF